MSQPDRPFARIALKDGHTINIFRDEDLVVSICHEDKCVNLPGASGQLTMEIVALLESLGSIVEFPEED